MDQEFKRQNIFINLKGKANLNSDSKSGTFKKHTKKKTDGHFFLTWHCMYLFQISEAYSLGKMLVEKEMVEKIG